MVRTMRLERALTSMVNECETFIVLPSKVVHRKNYFFATLSERYKHVGVMVDLTLNFILQMKFEMHIYIDSLTTEIPSLLYSCLS